MYPWPRSIRFWPWFIFDRRCLYCQGTTLARTDDVYNVLVHFRPVYVSIRLFILFFPGWPTGKSFRNLFCSFLGMTIHSLYISTSLHREKLSEMCWSFSVIFVFVKLKNHHWGIHVLFHVRSLGVLLLCYTKWFLFPHPFVVRQSQSSNGYVLWPVLIICPRDRFFSGRGIPS